MGNSIGRRLNLRDNALNCIRLVLAGLVIVSHAAPITGLAQEPQIGDLTLGHIAVGGFFAISGFLITRSRYRARFWPYVWRRVLRIVPGYWVCLLFTAFGAALLAGVIRGGWSFHDAEGFALSNGRFFAGGFEAIGKTLAGLPFPSAWNGSLWTLRYEVACYAVVGTVLLLGFVRRSRAVFVVLFIASTVMSAIVDVRGMTGALADLSLLIPFFAAGALLFAFEDAIPCDWRWAAAALVLSVITFATGAAGTFSALPIAYLLLWAGAVAPKALRRIGSRNDYSYGTYLYAFPVQQLLVIAGAIRFGLFGFTVLSLLATAPLAVASWHWIEKPAQRLKNLRRRAAIEVEPERVAG